MMSSEFVDLILLLNGGLLSMLSNDQWQIQDFTGGDVSPNFLLKLKMKKFWPRREGGWPTSLAPARSTTDNRSRGYQSSQRTFHISCSLTNFLRIWIHCRGLEDS